MDTVYTQEELNLRVANAVSEAIKDHENRYNLLNMRYESLERELEISRNLVERRIADAKHSERQWFAESVMGYDQGTPECRYQFLEALGLEGHVPSRTYTFNITVTASWGEETEPYNMLDDLKSALENYDVEIDNAEYETE